MIDDRPEIVLYLARKGIPVLMIDTTYNKNVFHEKVRRVYTWKEIYDVISEYTTENIKKGEIP